MQEQAQDFDAFEPENERAGAARWIFRVLLFILAVGAAAAAGYALGRGAWTLPGSIAAHMPEPLARWLPASGTAAAPPGGPPIELKEYVFELVKPEIKQADGVVVVRLVSKADGRPVPEAIIFARRLDMAPERMATMTSPLEAVPAEPGHYAFKADLAMEGNWRLSLAAKVQGEIGTVQNRLIFKAVE